MKSIDEYRKFFETQLRPTLEGFEKRFDGLVKAGRVLRWDYVEVPGDPSLLAQLKYIGAFPAGV